MRGDANTVPSRDDVVDALGRVLESDAFLRAERSRAFLAHVVSETLAGRAERISERTVGRAVLGRGPAFDGSADSSVRVCATRVRRALQRYYANDGADDPLRIVLPQGGYVPSFEVGRASSAASDAVVPGVLVVVPDHAGGDEAAVLALSVADALVHALVGFAAITVVGPTFLPDLASASSADAARAAGVSHALEGRVVVTDGGVGMVARLVSASEPGVRWSRSVDRPHDEPEALQDVDHAWASEIAAEVADHAGVVLTEVSRSTGATDDAGPLMRARLAYATYVDRATKESTDDAVAAVDAALEAGPRTAELLAMRGALENAAVLFGMREREAGTRVAESLAREALALDATNAHAYLVLGGCARAAGAGGCRAGSTPRGPPSSRPGTPPTWPRRGCCCAPPATGSRARR